MREPNDFTPSPSQTVGPYFWIGLTRHHSAGAIAGPAVKGERIKLTCELLDGQGEAILDGMIEIWQANAGGKYNHPEDTQDKPIDPYFTGYGRLGTDVNGICTFETIKPGRVPGPDAAWQAPHLEVSVFCRGLLKRAATRVYFAGDPSNDEDPILALVPKDRRETLMARPVEAQPGQWRIVLRLGGEDETVFFEV
jgi:protocatechuate 3,4-dioxygenase, alpha subunit